ncbi:MAG: IPTL-CTERM sorting domain-containing protein, partial [Deltaproteobacteria bacterium]|nr:IPTL-CTERM sorting domain-containing protein [Deltaproteobacteria bacterium]
FGSDLAEAEDAYSEFLQDFFVSREIICEEPIPTVNEWGLLALVLLLAGSASWLIRARKRQA